MNTTIMLFALIIGLAVALLAVGVSTILSNATDPVRRRVAAATASTNTSTGMTFDLGRFVDPVAKYVLPSKSEETNRTRERLVQAGYRTPTALRNFYGIKAALALLLPLITYVGVRWIPEMTTSIVVFLVALAAVIGARLPDYVLTKLRNKRMKRLRVAFPDALDLLVVCVESGLGLAAAIERVARELEISHSELAQELALVNAEISAGVERPVALRNLSARCGLDDIKGLVGLLVQTIRFGTSIADALRVYSEEFRDKRMQKAEEQAAKIGIKMIFPLVLCLFPSFFIVAVGPAVIRIVDAFSQL
jgi:tight adherence protein C